MSCDNQSAVRVCNTGKTKDQFLNACLHMLSLQAAHFNIALRVVHIPGKDNGIADALSRGRFCSDVHEYWDVILCDVLQLSL